jgi:hypothetical protein
VINKEKIMPRNDLNNSRSDRSDRQDKPVEKNDTAQGSSAKDQHVSTWGKATDASAPQTEQARLQRHLSEIGKRWVQEQTAEAGESLLQKQIERLNSLMPPPQERDIQAFPSMEEVPAENLPRVPENLTHSRTVQKLVDRPATGKAIAESYSDHIMSKVWPSLGREGQLIASTTAARIISVKDRLSELMTEGGVNAQNIYIRINTQLESIEANTRNSAPDALKTAIADFFSELHFLGL